MKVLALLVLVQVLTRGALGECPCVHREADAFFPGHEGMRWDCEFNNDGKLEVIPKECWALHDDVTQVFLDYNSITYIAEDAFVGLAGLRTLVISNNKISKIAEGAFLGMDSLEHLDLSSNKLFQPSSDLWNLTSLRFLSLGKNEIYEIKDATVSNLVNLNVLELHWNHLIKLPYDMLEPLLHLRTVHLHWNVLTRLPDMSANDHLTEVIIKGNALATLPKHLFGNLTEPMTFHFSSNPIYDIAASTLAPLPDLSHIKMEEDALIWAADVEEMELILNKRWNVIDGLGNILNIKDRLMLCAREKEIVGRRNRVNPC